MEITGSAAQSDEELMLLAGHGDERAFARLLERHLPRSLATARRLLAGGSEAEDLVQEACLRLWRKAPQWRQGGASVSTWLYRVLLNLAIDARRRTRRLTDDAPLAALADPSPDGFDRYALNQRQTRVRAAVDALPERQREAVALTYSAGLSNAESAQAMGLSVKAFEALLVRAKRSLRASLAAEIGE